MMQVITREYVMSLLKKHQALREVIYLNRDKEAEKIDEWEANKLALRIELGEFCNEWQGFKYWKKDRSPRTNEVDEERMKNEDGPWRDWPRYNPMLEEYADMLLFILCIGNYIEIQPEMIPESWIPVMNFPQANLMEVLDRAFKLYGMIYEHQTWFYALEICLAIGDHVGFTAEMITEAVTKKIKKNVARQSVGY